MYGYLAITSNQRMEKNLCNQFLLDLFICAFRLYERRLGLQAVTLLVLITCILGTFYRSVSLYHPQRRAILHLKSQKRKIKHKTKVKEKPPFFDVTTLKSKTIQILLVSTGISSFGINTPIIYLVSSFILISIPES